MGSAIRIDTQRRKKKGQGNYGNKINYLLQEK